MHPLPEDWRDHLVSPDFLDVTLSHKFALMETVNRLKTGHSGRLATTAGDMHSCGARKNIVIMIMMMMMGHA